jgi:DNA-binding NarL/FixJ family response regulator
MPQDRKPARRPTVLLAEDQLLVAMEIEASLRELGCEVVGPVATVAEVERLAARTDLDGAVLDIDLRGVKIFDVLPGLLARGLPVLLSSGYDDSAGLPDQFRRLPILVKPYGASQLGAALEALLASRPPA